MTDIEAVQFVRDLIKNKVEVSFPVGYHKLPEKVTKYSGMKSLEWHVVFAGDEDVPYLLSELMVGLEAGYIRLVGK